MPLGKSCQQYPSSPSVLDALKRSGVLNLPQLVGVLHQPSSHCAFLHAITTSASVLAFRRAPVGTRRSGCRTIAHRKLSPLTPKGRRHSGNFAIHSFWLGWAELRALARPAPVCGMSAVSRYHAIATPHVPPRVLRRSPSLTERAPASVPEA